MNEISIFHFQGSEVRIVNVNDEPWFVAKDVCALLDLSNVGQALSSLDEDEKSTIDPNIIIVDVGFDRVMAAAGKNVRAVIPEAGQGGRPLSLINEPGIYSLVLRSRKPEAKAFKRWVTHEVLPSIRKHGGYIAANGTETPEELYARALTSLKAALDRQKAIAAEQAVQLELQAPDVEYARNVLASDGLHTVNAVAVHLGISAIRLNKFLIAENWIYRQGDVYYPAIRIREKGYCDFHVVPYLNSQGEKMTREHLKWTEAGRRAIIELWNKRHPAA